MSLKDKLNADLKDAMKNKDKVKKSVVILVRAAIKQYEIDNREQLDDSGVIAIISKQLKMVKDSLESFKKADREDLIEQAEMEIAVLLEYMPKQLSEDELTDLIREVMSNINATSMKDMGKIMAQLMPKIKGKADGAMVKNITEKLIKDLA